MTCSELIAKAGLKSALVLGKKYHSPLAKELESFYCYMSDGGHCILVLLPGSQGPVDKQIVPAPVKAVLRRGYTIENGYVVCDLPYSSTFGLICEEDDDEFDIDGSTAEHIVVSNNGRLINSTNYWTSSYATNGYCYFSVNAGCVRLLLPDNCSAAPNDDVLNATRYVIISRGELFGRDGYEVIFEDESDNPFVIHTAANQWEQAIPRTESGRTGIGFDIYKDGQRIRQMAARFRAVSHLPYLEPWKPHK